MSKNTNKKPIILALETSGRIGSAAIGVGGRLLSEKTFTTPVKHSAELFPAIEGLLADIGKTPADIEHIYISIGPGSFTGLRIAVTFAKIMHLANNNVRIVAVDTLDVIAANAIDFFQANPAQNTKTIACILDAKRGRFFIAAYRITSISSTSLTTSDTPPEKILDDKLWTPQQFFDEFASKNESLLLLGEGLVYYRNLFKPVPSPESRDSGHPSSLKLRRAGEQPATAYDVIDFLDEKYWYPSASKVYSLGYRLAEEKCFSAPLSLIPKYIQSPDTGNW